MVLQALAIPCSLLQLLRLIWVLLHIYPDFKDPFGFQHFRSLLLLFWLYLLIEKLVRSTSAASSIMGMTICELLVLPLSLVFLHVSIVVLFFFGIRSFDGVANRGIGFGQLCLFFLLELFSLLIGLVRKWLLLRCFSFSPLTMLTFGYSSSSSEIFSAAKGFVIYGINLI